MDGAARDSEGVTPLGTEDTAMARDGSRDIGVLRDGRRPPFFWIENAVIDTFGPVLGPSALAVYTALVRRGNARGLTVMSVSTIAANCGMGVTAVRTALERLERLDLIEVYTRFGDKGQRLASEFVIADLPSSVRADWETRSRPSRDLCEDPDGWKSRTTGIRGGKNEAPPESEGASEPPTGIRGGSSGIRRGALRKTVPPPPESEGLSRRTPQEKKSPGEGAERHFEIETKHRRFLAVESHLLSDRKLTIEVLVASGIVDADQWDAVMACEQARFWVKGSKVADRRFSLDRALAEMIDVS